MKSLQPWQTMGRMIGWSLLLPCCLAGCESKRHVPAGPVLAPAELGLAEAAARDGYEIVDRQPSVGQFPAAIAVARVQQAGDGDSGERRWRIVTMKEQQGAYWNSLFNATPEIREVLILNERTPLVRGEGIASLAGSAQRLGAALCLVYGASYAEPGEAALSGILLDAQNGESLARLSAHATRVDFESPRPDRPSGDNRHQDVEYLAARKFERLFHRCVLELIDRDSPPAATRPSKWHGVPADPPPIYIIPEPMLP